MRKPRLNEAVIIGYASYVWFTLTIDPEFFYNSIAENPASMYAMYTAFLGSQTNLALFSLALALANIGVLFTRNYVIRVITSITGIVYFTILAASYIFSYPNLGLGLSAIMIVILIFDVNRLIDEYAESKKKEIFNCNFNGGTEDE